LPESVVAAAPVVVWWGADPAMVFGLLPDQPNAHDATTTAMKA